MPGVSATSHGVSLPPGAAAGRLRSFAFWSVFAAEVGETMVVRLYRYRRLTPTGPFVFSQITDAFTFDSSQPGAYVIPLDGLIRDFDLVASDTIAASRVYDAGEGGSILVTRMQWEIEATPASAEAEAAAAALALTPPAWAPGS